MMISELGTLVGPLSFGFGRVEIVIPIACCVDPRSVLANADFADANRLDDDPCR